MGLCDGQPGRADRILPRFPLSGRNAQKMDTGGYVMLNYEEELKKLEQLEQKDNFTEYEIKEIKHIIKEFNK